MTGDDALREDSRHLTDDEIAQLLNGETGAQVLEQANRHLDECKDCQDLLKNCAASPEDWKRFTTVMQSVAQHESDSPSGFRLLDHQWPPTDRRIGWAAESTTNRYAVAAIVVLFFVVLICLANVSSRQNETPTSAPPVAPQAPLGPTNPPAAPTPDTSGVQSSAERPMSFRQFASETTTCINELN